MPNTRANYSAFVPAGDDRRETARILTQTATEHGIDQRSIRLARGGFDITDELADVLYDEDADETTEAVADAGDEIPKSVPATQSNPQSRKGKGDSTTNRASGNRAAKNNDSEEE